MTELLKAFSFLSVLIILAVWYELSGNCEILSGIVQGKQIRRLEGKEDLFYIRIWYNSGDVSTSNFYSLFVDESDYNRLWEGDAVTFTAKKESFHRGCTVENLSLKPPLS